MISLRQLSNRCILLLFCNTNCRYRKLQNLFTTKRITVFTFTFSILISTNGWKGDKIRMKNTTLNPFLIFFSFSQAIPFRLLIYLVHYRQIASHQRQLSRLINNNNSILMCKMVSITIYNLIIQQQRVLLIIFRYFQSIIFSFEH